MVWKRASETIFIALTLVAALTPARVAAQELADLKPGQRVRLGLLPEPGSSGEPTTLEGRFGGLRDGSLILQTDESEVAIPLTRTTAIESRRSRWGAVGRGALFGGLAGAGFGVAVSGSDDDSFLDDGAGGWALLSGVFGAGCGAVIGALFGGGWRDVDLTGAAAPQDLTGKPQFSWGVVPVRDGGSLGLSIRW